MRLEALRFEFGVRPAVARVGIYGVERGNPGREMIGMARVDAVERALGRLADDPLRAHLANDPRQIATQCERGFDRAVGVREEAHVLDADDLRGRDLLVAAQRSHLRAWDAELRAAGVAIGHDAVGDLDAAVGPHRDRARDAEVDIIGMRHDHEDAFDSVEHKRFHGAPN